MADRFQHLFDSLKEEVVVMDRDLRISYANRAWLSRLDLALAQVLGQPCYKVFEISQEACAAAACITQEVIRTGRPIELPCRGCPRHATLTGTLISASPVFDDQGEVAQVIELAHPPDHQSIQQKTILIQQRLAEALREAALLTDSGQSLQLVLDAILDQISDVIQFDSASIVLLEKNDWHLLAGRGLPPNLDLSHLIFSAQDPKVEWLQTHKQPLIIPDVHQNPNWRSVEGTEYIHSWMGAPLLTRGKMIGILNLDNRVPNYYTAEDAHMVMVFANHAAAALENARLLESERSRSAQLRLLSDLGQRVLSILDPEALLEYAVTSIQQQFGYYHVDVFLIDPEGKRAVFKASSDRESAAYWREHNMSFRVGEEGITGHVAASGEPYLTNDVSQDPRYVGDCLLPETRSELAIPIRVGDRVVGVLDLNSDQVNAFDEDDLFVTRSLADQLAVGLENARLYEAAERRVAELEAVRRASLGLTSSLELRTVLETILETTMELVNEAKDTHVFLFENDRLRFGAALWADGSRGTPWAEPRPEGLTYTVARTGEMIVVPDMQNHPIFEDAPPEWEGAMVGLPLRMGTRVMGVMSIAYSQPCNPSEAELRILRLLADQAAIAIENARLFAAERQSWQRLQSIQATAAALGTELDLDTLPGRIVAEAARAFQADAVSIMLWDQDQQYLRIQASQGLSAKYAQQQRISHKVVNDSIPAFASGEPLYVADLAQRPFGERSLIEEEEICSVLIVPMVVRGDAVGALNIYSKALPRTFGPAELGLAKIFGAQAAVMIANAELFAAEARRRREAETLQAATQALSKSMDLSEILTTILTELQKVVPYDSATVQALEADRLKIIGGHGFPNLDELLGIEFNLQASDNPNRKVIHQRAPLILGDAPSIYKEFQREPHAQARIRSWLGIPLLFGDRLIGMLALDKRQPEFYTKEHARLAMAFAAQAAIAIHNARLFQETETRAREMASLAAVGRAMTTLELDDVLNSIAENALQAANTEISSVYLLDEEHKCLIPRSVCGIDWQELKTASFALGEGTIGQVAQTGQPLIVHNVTTAQVFVPKTGAATRIRNVLTVPFMVKKRVIGTLEVCNKVGGGGFTETDRRLLTAFADQAAIVIENARLYQEVSHHLEEVQILNKVAQAATSTLNFDQVVRRSVNALLGVRNFERVNIMLLDESRQVLRLHPALTESRTARNHADLDIPRGKGIAGWVAETGKPYLVSDVRQEPRYIAGYPDSRSELCVPLRIGNRVVGVLDVQSTQPDAFSESDERLLGTLSGQISTLLENSRLFAETQQRVRELTALMQVSRALNEAEGLDTILNIILDEAFNLIGSREGTVILIDPPGSNLLRIVAARGLDPENVEAFNNRPVYTYEGTYKRALRTGEMIEVPDTSIDPDFLRDVDSQAKSVTNIPLVAERGAIGLIAVDGVPRDDTTRRLLTALTGMAAIAIDKERLHQETANRLAEVSTLYTLSTQITTSLSSRAVLEAIVTILRLTLDCRSCSIFLLDATGDYLQLEAGSGPSATWKGIARLRVGEGISGRVITERRSIYIPNTERESDFIFFDPQIRSLLVVPLIVRNKAVGTLSIDDTQPYAFDDEVRLLTIAAAQAAVAIENAQLYESLQKSYQDLELAYEDLRELDKMKSELIQNVSHELRTPLTFIRGYVELLQDGEMGPLQEGQQAALDIVSNKAEVLSKLVDDIISMQQANREQLRLEPLSLAQLGRAAIQAAMVSAQEAEMTLVDEISTDIPLVWGDRRRLGQVFDNLLQNAIKFSHPGGTIFVRTRREGAGVRAEVEDTGIGIAPDQLSRVFERFYQVDGTMTRRFGGTGLGLAIVKQIVEAHGGQVGVESEPDKGSLFYFVIPEADIQEK